MTKENQTTVPSPVYVNNENVKDPETPAVCKYAWRNKGEKSPISVQFVQERPRVFANSNAKAVAMSMGISPTIMRYMNMSFSEEGFNKLFGNLGYAADEITNSFRDGDDITAHSLDSYTTEDIYGIPFYICRFETNNAEDYIDESGDIKSGWQPKKVGDVHFTQNNLEIYSTVVFDEEPGEYILDNDQYANGEFKNTKSNVDAIKETAPAKKETKVEEVEAKVEEEENEEVSFDF